MAKQDYAYQHMITAFAFIRVHPWLTLSVPLWFIRIPILQHSTLNQIAPPVAMNIQSRPTSRRLFEDHLAVDVADLIDFEVSPLFHDKIVRNLEDMELEAGQSLPSLR